MRVASLDLGTNTFLLLIADVMSGQVSEVITDQVRLVRLGQDMNQTKKFHPDALKRAEDCFKEYAELISKHNVNKTVAMATSASRDASNKNDFFKLGKKYNIPIEVITGDQEARLTYMGATYDMDQDQNYVVIDVGGGSTEIIGKNGSQIKGRSIDIGSVRLTEMFIKNDPPHKSELLQLQAYISEQLIKNKEHLPEPAPVIAVAGTPTTLVQLEQHQDFSEKDIHKKNLHKTTINKWFKKLSEVDLQQRIQLKGLEPKRADVIVAGTSILYHSLEYLGQENVIVSTKGVRYGAALSC